MECQQAQRIVSERLDGEHVDPAVLEEAKDHCRACEECGAFVHTLATLRMMPLPQPPDEMVERVMAALAAERAASLASGARPESRSGASNAAAGAQRPDRGLIARLTDRRHRRAVAAWGAAAALVVIVAGITAVSGVRQILAPNAGVRTYEVESAAPGVTEKEFGASAGTAADSSSMLAATDTAPSYITVGTSVYLADGQPSTVESASLTAVGATTSSLGTGQVTQRTVLGAGDPSTVFIITADGSVLSFTRVTREFGGRTYALTGGPITEYGKWPTLPPGFETPTGSDGAPEFVAAGTDSNGVRVFKRRGRSTAEGIAVAPGTAADDPAAGSPNWTWWESYAQ